MVERKTLALGFLGIFAFYSFWLMRNAERLADVMFSGNFITGLFVYMIANPAYLLLVFGIMWTHKDSLIKSFFAGMAVTLALDIISVPRLPLVMPMVGGVVDFSKIAVSNVVFANSDFIIAKTLIGAGISYTTFWYFYYWFLPVGLVILGIYLLGYANFLKRLTGR